MINTEGNSLFINEKQLTFDYDILDTLEFDDLIIVLLYIPADDETIDNIYAVTLEGEIAWRVESLSLVMPNILNLPYEYIELSDEGELLATDFYGRRYHIDCATGKILGKETFK